MIWYLDTGTTIPETSWHETRLTLIKRSHHRHYSAHRKTESLCIQYIPTCTYTYIYAYKRTRRNACAQFCCNDYTDAETGANSLHANLNTALSCQLAASRHTSPELHHADTTASCIVHRLHLSIHTTAHGRVKPILGFRDYKLLHSGDKLGETLRPGFWSACLQGPLYCNYDSLRATNWTTQYLSLWNEVPKRPNLPHPSQYIVHHTMSFPNMHNIFS